MNQSSKQARKQANYLPICQLWIFIAKVLNARVYGCAVISVYCCGGRSSTAVYSCGAFVERAPQQFTPVQSGTSTA
eukprot:7622410-Lingulodinium_polyedra.AAC.1